MKIEISSKSLTFNIKFNSSAEFDNFRILLQTLGKYPIDIDLDDISLIKVMKTV